MTIELLDYQLEESAFTLNEAVSLSRTGNGRAVSRVEYGDPWISAKFSTGKLTRNERARWEAWKAGLRGGLVSFFAYDVSRAYPIAYPAGVPEIEAAIWNGQGTVSAIVAHQVTAAGAPAGFQLKAGDLVGLVEGGRYGLFFVSADATAGASSIVVNVEPAIPQTVFTIAAAIVFYRPKGEFILLADSWQCSKRNQVAPVSFEAVQKT